MPIGPNSRDSIRELALIEAFGEIQNTPPVQLAAILAKAKKEMGG